MGPVFRDERRGAYFIAAILLAGLIALALLRVEGPMLLVIGGGAFMALLAIYSRAQSRTNMERLRLLNDIAAVANFSISFDDTLRALEECVVPTAADFYMIDRVYRDDSGRAQIERISVAASGPGREQVVERLTSRMPSVPREMVEGELAGDPNSNAVRLVTPVTDAKLRELAQDEDDLRFLRSLKMNSYLHVALRSRGQHLGVITMAVAWSGRRYRDEHVAFAEILAGRIALALDNAGLTSDLRLVETRLQTAMAVLEEAVLIHERSGRLSFANPAAARLFRVENPSLLVDVTEETVESWCRFFDEDGMPIPYNDLLALLTGETADNEAESLRAVFHADGEEVWLRARVSTVRDDDDQVLFAVTALEDLTDILREEFEQSLLGEVGEVVTTVADGERMLRQMAELLVPKVADCCAVDLLEHDGDWRRIAFLHRNPSEVDRKLLSSGRAVHVDLRIRGERVGMVSLANQPDRHGLGEADEKLIGRILELASHALENARLAADRAEIAASLQQGLIPPPLPDIPGWEIGALYRPAGEQNEVGGDFYEAFPIDSGWMVVIGDVTGRGAKAASVTAQARYTMRTAGTMSREPQAVLAALNRALYARPDNPLCSAVVIVLREHTSRAEVLIAGHPPPLLLDEGEVIEVGSTGPVLGAFEEASWPLRVVSLGSGGQLVVHTDGITEAARDGERFGEARLHGCLMGDPGPATNSAPVKVLGDDGRLPGAPGTTELLGMIERSLQAFVGGPLRDDAASLAISRAVSELPEALSDEDPDAALIRQAFDAFNRRSISEMRSICAEEVEFHFPTSRLAGRDGPYRGPEGISQYVEDTVRIWDDIMVTPNYIARVGRWLAVSGRTYARSRPLGMRDLPTTWLWRVSDGRVTRSTVYPDLRRALSFAEREAG